MSETTAIAAFADIPVTPPVNPILLDPADQEYVQTIAGNGSYYIRNKRSASFVWPNLDVTSAQILVGLLDPPMVAQNACADVGQCLLVNNVAGYAAGATQMVIDNFHAADAVLRQGWCFTVQYRHPIYMLTADASVTGGSATISFTPALMTAVTNNEEVYFARAKLVGMQQTGGGVYAVKMDVEAYSSWIAVNQAYLKTFDGT